jgi:hypothetical protein
VTKIPIRDTGKEGAMFELVFVFESQRRQVIAFPKYNDITRAVKIVETTSNFKAIPLHERKETDPSNTIYYTDSISNLCTSDQIKEILKEIQAKGSKFTSKIHAKYHPDPETPGKADHQCPYTIQNDNYNKLINIDFFILITTISRAAYVTQTLYANGIHLALNEAYYKDDFVTKYRRTIERPEELNEIPVQSIVNGYSHVVSDRVDFSWFKEIEDNKILIPSALEELLINLLNIGMGNEEKIRIYSRDAYISHNYLPKVQGFEYVNNPYLDFDVKVPHKYFPKFKLSNTAFERMDFLNTLLFFKKFDRIVKSIANECEGKIALLLNDELNHFFSILKNYRSEEMQQVINQHLAKVDDIKKLEFIRTINIGRKRKFTEDTPVGELIQKVIADYYVRYLKEEPWTRVDVMSAKTAFYKLDFSPDYIILLGTNYQFFQAIQLVSDGKVLDYHSVKGGGITFKNKELEKSVCKIYVKALKSLSDRLSVRCVYVLDPMFSYWYKTYPQLFELIQVESNNLERESFVLKDFDKISKQ